MAQNNNFDEAPLSELWSRAVVSEYEAARMLGLPISSWQLQKRRAAPPIIALGKHKRILTEDLRRWLETIRDGGT